MFSTIVINLTTMTYLIDEIDCKLISALRGQHRASISDVARATGMARGTVQSRLARLVESAAVTGWGPEVASAATGYDVTAFTTLSITQGAHDKVVAGLAAIPEVLEVHVITGGGDLLCRLVARSNDHLHDLLQQVVGLTGVARADSHLALQTPVSRTLADLLSATASASR